MTTIDLTTATIANTSKLLKNHELSPVELTKATLERIDRLDSQDWFLHYCHGRLRHSEGASSRGRR